MRMRNKDYNNPLLVSNLFEVSTLSYIKIKTIYMYVSMCLFVCGG